MQRVRKQIGADFPLKERWMKQGITVAVLDTGVGRHIDLNGRLLCFRDFVTDSMTMYDNNGHGTHVCGIICGNGAYSNGEFRGLAPYTRLVVGKVLDENGDGMTEKMLQGLQWVIDNKEKYDIRILNISVGIGELRQVGKAAALKSKIEEAWDRGIVVICAAGNKGPDNGSISSIGGSDKVITVGCHDGEYCRGNDKRCETYSGRGNLNDPLRKPDIVAPGTDIWSCNAHAQWQHGKLKNPYISKSGTSMATPIVTGCVSLLLQKEPYLTNEQVKQRLIYTASDLGEEWNKQGWGMVNVKRLLDL